MSLSWVSAEQFAAIQIGQRDSRLEESTSWREEGGVNCNMLTLVSHLVPVSSCPCLFALRFIWCPSGATHRHSYQVGSLWAVMSLKSQHNTGPAWDSLARRDAPIVPAKQRLAPTLLQPLSTIVIQNFVSRWALKFLLLKMSGLIFTMKPCQLQPISDYYIFIF